MIDPAAQRTREPRSYTVIVKLKSKGGSVPDTVMAYATLAASAAEAEEAVMARHHKDWEAYYLFDGIEAAFPTQEAAM
ncbi:MAG: hypothetical protein KatS3mg123_2577 [Burkholderiales bacterium]|nr:MAG: hypothetical protein KatS3mg123_2577 [Burkholderiales bacterium]